jgi:hypothetical protein
VLDVDRLALGRACGLELVVVEHHVLARAHLEALDHLPAIDLAPVGVHELMGDLRAVKFVQLAELDSLGIGGAEDLHGHIDAREGERPVPDRPRHLPR